MAVGKLIPGGTVDSLVGVVVVDDDSGSGLLSFAGTGLLTVIVSEVQRVDPPIHIHIHTRNSSPAGW
jgi:hypothetical protein